jgi:putative endopeptidase
MEYSHFSAVTLCLALLAGTATAQTSQKTDSHTTQESKSGLDLTAIDKSASPCGSFYQYACGAWNKSHPIPADESSWGRFNELLQRNQEILRGILEDSAKNQDRSPVDQKIGGFYQSCMSEPLIEQRGTMPLQAELQRIARIGNQDELLDEVARLHERQVGVFFNFSSSPDPKNARMSIADLDQGGIGLPERDFYLRTDSKSEEIRRKYLQHVAKMFELIGVQTGDAQKKAATIMSIETDLAKASLDVTTRRDPQQRVHEMSKEKLAALSPHFNFSRFFVQVNAPQFTMLNVAVPDFVKTFNSLIASRDLSDLRDYLTWHFVSASARLLPKAFVDENFDFYGKTLTGVTELRPRWKRCVSATDDELGEALGKKYVEKTFGEQGKRRTLDLVHEIEEQMSKDLQSLTWMSPETKKQALIKLTAVANKIGYPEKWRDYSSIEIDSKDYFGNWYRANEFESKRDRDKIGKPVDRAEWEMTPPTVNAYYDPTENNINFPAGILQPPFYSNAATDAVNYGAIGVVIGHELTHGFDDQGRKFDADGNLKEWWQVSDEQRFNKLADCFVKEYSSFEAAPGVHQNGKLTLGENTADNGGIRLAYMALMDALAKKQESPSGRIDGYTQPQQFFLGFAQIWCENMRPEFARLLAQTDPHSLPEFRVTGVVKNMPEFGSAFGCKTGDQMYIAPGQGCRVW